MYFPFFLCWNCWEVQSSVARDFCSNLSGVWCLRLHVGDSMGEMELKPLVLGSASFDSIIAASGTSHWLFFPKSWMAAELLPKCIPRERSLYDSMQQTGHCQGWTSQNSLVSMSMGLKLGCFFLQRYFGHKTHSDAHKSLDSNLFSSLTGYASTPKEFSLCKVSKIKEGLGKTLYFKSVFNDSSNYVLTCLETLWELFLFVHNIRTDLQPIL